MITSQRHASKVRMVLLLLAAVAICVQAVITSTPAAAASNQGEFRVRCGISAINAVDPIVMPGMTGMGHMHTFFGNKSVDQNSTLATLRAAKSTNCTRPGDTSAYWIPSLMQRNVEVKPNAVDVYYRSAGLPTASIRAIPAGLKVVAGSSKATSATKQSIDVASWACTNRAGSEIEQQSIPAGCNGQGLRARIVFPQCWNGTDLDSPNHQSHMAYSSHGKCPAGYPVAIPQVTLSLHYKMANTNSVTLSSGDQYTLHADLFAAWQPGVQEKLIQDCIAPGRKCKIS